MSHSGRATGRSDNERDRRWRIRRGNGHPLVLRVLLVPIDPFIDGLEVNVKPSDASNHKLPPRASSENVPFPEPDPGIATEY
jgi:hypothetical protein